MQDSPSNPDEDIERTAAAARRASIRMEHSLGLREKQFLIAVERGDMASMKDILLQSEVGYYNNTYMCIIIQYNKIIYRPTTYNIIYNKIITLQWFGQHVHVLVLTIVK